MTTGSKICSRCGESKLIQEFYTKGTRVDAACKGCIKASKRKVTEVKVAGINAERLQNVAAIVESYELNKLNEYHSRIREIIERCEQRLQEREHLQ